RKPSTARASSMRSSPISRGSACGQARRRPPWRSRHERALRQPRGRADPALDVRLHRHLVLGLGAASQEDVRCARAHPDAGGPGARRRREAKAVSTFWSVWVMGLIVLNLGVSLALFWWAQRVDIPTAP